MSDAVVIATESNEAMLNEVSGINKEKVATASEVLDEISILHMNKIMLINLLKINKVEKITSSTLLEVTEEERNIILD